MNRSSSVKITVNGVYFLIKACALFYICMLVGNIVLKQPAYLSRSLSLSSTPISQSSLSNALFTTKAQHILKCSTSKGSFSVQLYPEICPNSVKQLTSLVNTSFLDQGIAFWRVNQWITQFGAHESPAARKKRNSTDPFASVRKSFINDPHPACLRFGLLNKTACKESKLPQVMKARKNSTWDRGTFAVIGSTALIVVISGNSQMGTAGHDCPVGKVLGDGMEKVFDHLYKDYGNAIDTKSGPDQRDLFREGISFMKREYPLVDSLNDCVLI